MGDFGYGILNKPGNIDFDLIVFETPPFGFHDGYFFSDSLRIMRSHLGSEAVFQRGDNASPVGIVLRIGTGDHEDIQGQPDPVAPDLNITLLHQVEEADLNPFGQVRKLVNGKDTAVGPGYEAVMNGKFI